MVYFFHGDFDAGIGGGYYSLLLFYNWYDI